MRSISTILLLVVLCASLALSQKEPFLYPVTLNGLGAAGNGWGGPWKVDTSAHGAEGTATLVGNSFAYSNLTYATPDTGSAVQVTLVNAWSDANRYKRALASTWPNTAGKTYWVSYLLDMKTVPQPNTYFMVKLYYTTDLLSSSGELVAIGKGGGATTPVFTCGSGWPGSSGDDVSSVPVAAGPVRLVARFDMSGGANSRTYMWVDPDPSKAPDTTKAAVKRWTPMPSGFNAVAIEYGGDVSTTPIVFVMDAIRITNSYAGLTSNAITGVNQSASVRPAEFSLSQNYPNPFNPTTEINYSLRTAGQVRLTVYNILGSEVMTLVDGVQAAGVHNVHFAGAGLASGMYFYTLESGGMTLTKKMLLLK
jgi:hypothetical protein